MGELPHEEAKQRQAVQKDHSSMACSTSFDAAVRVASGDIDG